MNKNEFIRECIQAVERVFNRPYTKQITGDYYNRSFDPVQEEWVDGYCWLGAASWGLGMSYSTIQHVMVENGFHIAEWNDKEKLSWHEINQRLLELIENE